MSGNKIKNGLQELSHTWRLSIFQRHIGLADSALSQRVLGGHEPGNRAANSESRCWRVIPRLMNVSTMFGQKVRMLTRQRLTAPVNSLISKVQRSLPSEIYKLQPISSRVRITALNTVLWRVCTGHYPHLIYSIRNLPPLLQCAEIQWCGNRQYTDL
jgi:hypothetical protein